MNQYKSKDFLKTEPQQDTLLWVSSDKKFTITTTVNQWSKFFVYLNTHFGMEWVEISCDSLDDAIQELNMKIESGDIQKYL